MTDTQGIPGTHAGPRQLQHLSNHIAMSFLQTSQTGRSNDYVIILFSLTHRAHVFKAAYWGSASLKSL